MEVLSVILAHSLNGELIHRVEQKEHLEAALTQLFHLRQLLNRRLILCRCVVDALLALGHPLSVFLQRNKLTLLRTVEEQEILQLVHRIAAGVHAVVDADLQCAAVLLPELFVVLAVLVELFAQCLENVLLQCAADGLQLTALLQQLTRDVQ